jgi:Polyketide cyclase / dehydrase and lipid transport
MVKKVLIALAGLVAIFLGYVATRPDTYHVERSTKIAAPADIIFAQVSDFAAFGAWSPWAKRDPAMKLTISTPSAGVGASYAWEGNKEVGKGKMTLTESQPPTLTKERLEFLEPFPSIADTGFKIKPEGAGAASVTWYMDGKSNFMGKVMSVFMNMDQMIGKDFEEGLSNLKRISEAKAAAAVTAAAPAEPAAEPAKTPASAPVKTP